MPEKTDFMQVAAISVAVICVVLIYAFFLTLPVWWLWNSIIPEITNGRLKEITFVQALQLNLLFGIVFRIWMPHKSAK